VPSETIYGTASDSSSSEDDFFGYYYMHLVISDSYEENNDDLELLMNFDLDYALGVAYYHDPKRPFVELWSLQDFSITAMTVDGYAVLVPSSEPHESKYVHLTGALEGIHLMNSYYNYLNERFF
jgi:hypothetical protein